MTPIPSYERLYVDKCGNNCHLYITPLKKTVLEATPLEFTTWRNITRPKRESNLMKDKLIQKHTLTLQLQTMALIYLYIKYQLI